MFLNVQFQSHLRVIDPANSIGLVKIITDACKAHFMYPCLNVSSTLINLIHIAWRYGPYYSAILAHNDAIIARDLKKIVLVRPGA